MEDIFWSLKEEVVVVVVMEEEEGRELRESGKVQAGKRKGVD